MTTLLDLLSKAPPPAHYKNAAMCDNHPPALVVGVEGDTIMLIERLTTLMVPLVEYGPEPDYADKAIVERIIALLEGALLGREVPKVTAGALVEASALVDDLNRQIAPLQVETLLTGNPLLLERAKQTGLPVIEVPLLKDKVLGVPGPEHLGHDFQVDGRHGLVVFGSRVAACQLAETV